ncbi:lipoyl(octanoyl) transferase LipB [Agriterribacter sp.]|uniref:lipoyl(octanoyl) transferase LipB n=1 Tax=Agriterribacter sp. TaxID=2821509 RepID=UPI002BAFA351|nr:lipoyl(octanoyl) transferase LipB [Agriterribacter sp.]HRP55702.1 lipoyl(octanoyl) transferase LipB [Agriterribacter sp.]
MQEVFFKDMGAVAYKDAWDFQEQLLRKNVQAKTSAKAGLSYSSNGTGQKTGFESIADTRHHLLLCEHPPVYTLGKSGHAENVLISEATLHQKGIEYYRTNRGGDITFHGPGQIVGYPILDLEKYYTDIGKYLRNLEEVVILTLQQYGIKGERSPGETGVWIAPSVKGKERKICAMGVRCSRWVTMHGFALNVSTSLDYFNYIIPCGIANKQVTSIEKELGSDPGTGNVKAVLKNCFEQVFDCRLVG